MLRFVLFRSYSCGYSHGSNIWGGYVRIEKTSQITDLSKSEKITYFHLFSVSHIAKIWKITLFSFVFLSGPLSNFVISMETEELLSFSSSATSVSNAVLIKSGGKTGNRTSLYIFRFSAYFPLSVQK